MFDLSQAKNALSPWALADLTDMMQSGNTPRHLILNEWTSDWATDAILGHDGCEFVRAHNYLAQYLDSAKRIDDIPFQHTAFIANVIRRHNADETVREAIKLLSLELLTGLEILDSQQPEKDIRTTPHTDVTAELEALPAGTAVNWGDNTVMIACKDSDGYWYVSGCMGQLSSAEFANYMDGSQEWYALPLLNEKNNPTT